MIKPEGAGRPNWPRTAWHTARPVLGPSLQLRIYTHTPVLSTRDSTTRSDSPNIASSSSTPTLLRPRGLQRYEPSSQSTAPGYRPTLGHKSALSCQGTKNSQLGASSDTRLKRYCLNPELAARAPPGDAHERPSLCCNARTLGLSFGYEYTNCRPALVILESHPARGVFVKAAGCAGLDDLQALELKVLIPWSVAQDQNFLRFQIFHGVFITMAERAVGTERQKPRLLAQCFSHTLA
ncbi:hypothetical protein LZ31DRAFT_81047 [Colletotrichum somersetense]|nr:hypothetical protein LZ31DRAFT_81047 [Colletotrichum somersetense]